MSRVKEFTLPDLGEGLTEAEILQWLVNVGDTIDAEPADRRGRDRQGGVEIPAKWAGEVTEIFHEAGTTVEVGTPIIAIDTDPAPATGRRPRRGRRPPALAAVEIAPAEGAIEPGLIGGPAPGGRTAVLVGYGPKTAVAKRRARKDDGYGSARSRRRAAPHRSRAPVAAARSPARAGAAAGTARRSTATGSRRWPSRPYASWPRILASICTCSSGSGRRARSPATTCTRR